MRAALGVLVCAALVGAVPNLLPGDPRLAEGGDHHHGDHHGDHGDHEDHGDHGDHGDHHEDHGDHGDVGDHATDASAPEGTVDYGAGIQVTPREDDQEGHFNPFLPSYQPVAGPRRPASRQPDGQIPTGLSQEASNFNQRLTSQPNQQALRPFTPIRPEDLNLNPGVGESGQKDVVRRECGSGLICVPEERCDRYTGFVKGVLQRTEDPSLPTVAIQRCQLEGSTGFCCQQKPRPLPQFENQGQQTQTYPNQAQSPAFQPANQQTSSQFSNQQSPQSQQQPQQFFNTQQPQQVSNERPPQQFSNQQRPLQQYEDQQSSEQLGNRPLQQFSSQQQASQQFSTQQQPPQQFGNQQQPLQRPVNPLPSRPFDPIRPEDLNLNPGVGESGQKDVVRQECGSGLICVPEEQCDRYTGFVKGALDSATDPSLPTIAIQRCQLDDSTGFCCQQKPKPLPQFANQGQQTQAYPNQAQSPTSQIAIQGPLQQFSAQQQPPQQFSAQQQPQQQFSAQQQPPQQFSAQQQPPQQFSAQQQQPQQIANQQRPPQQFSNQQRPPQQFSNQQRPPQQFSNQQQRPQQFLNQQRPPQQYENQRPLQNPGTRPSQQFPNQQQPPQQFGNQQQPLQRPVNPPPSRPFDPIRPEDLNLNPGVGESGQKDVVRQECGSGLICVPEEQCDRYTGFVKGALDSATDPSLPTIAIQRCQLDDSTGFCCQQKPKSLPQFANQKQQPQTYPNQAQPPVFPSTNQQASQQFSNQRPPQQFSSQQPSQQFFNQRPPQQFSNQQTSQPFSNQRPVQQFSNQQPVQQFSNQRPSQQFSNQQQQPQKFSSQQRPPQQYEDQQPSAVQEGNRQRPTQQFPNQQRPPQQSENQQSSRPFESIRPEDLNLNPGVGESGQKDVVRRACGAGLICVPEERCDRYTGFVKGALQRTLDPSLPTVAIQRCQLEDTTGFCCQPTPGRPNGGRPVSGGRRPLQGNERVPQSGGQSFPSSPNTPGRRPLGPQPARFSNNPFLNSATSGVSRPQDRVSAGPGPRPRPSSAPTAPQRGVAGRPQSGEEIRCGNGLECVQVNRCGADGYTTDRAGLGASSPGLRTFCMTAYQKRGVCCRTRPGSALQPGSLSNSRPGPQKSQRLQVKPNSPLQQAQGPSKSQPQQQQTENPNQKPDVAKFQSGLSSSGLLPPPPSETFGPDARGQPSSASEADPEIPPSSETDQEAPSSPGADPKIPPASEEESVALSEDTGVPFGCGLSRPIEAPGIQTAEGDAEFGELPWQAIILYTNYTFVCGGALVSDLHVVLSAHCVQYLEASDILVRLGEYQINSEKEPYPHQDIAVDIIYMHPGFRQGPLFRDIAVLKLSSPVKPSPHISAICLPRENQSFAGRRGIASGWGLAAFDAGIAASLQKVDVPILENGECEAQLKKTSLGSFFRLDSSFTCAGGEADVNACQDGGGPLSCRVDGRYFLAGVASWSIGCGVKDVPAVFASAPSTMDFIEVAMGLAPPDTNANSIKRATDRDEGFPYGR